MTTIKPIKLGVRFTPAAVVLVYRDEQSKKLRRRVIPTRSIDILTDIKVFAKTFRMNEKNRKYFQDISERKLEKILFILQDHLKGYSLKESIARSKKIEEKADNDDEDEDVEDFEDEDEEEEESKDKKKKEKIETNHEDDEDFSF